MSKRYDWLLKYKNFNEDQCLIWPFACFTDGYARAYDPRTQTDHHAGRLMCELVYGDPPEGYVNCLHSCDNIKCVNPKHLRWGNQSQNMIDKYSRKNKHV